MNILVIGNGFDLAHGLKTSYKDFLKFISDFEEQDQARTSNTNQGWPEGADLTYVAWIIKIFNEVKSNNIYKEFVTEFRYLIKDNLWINHFRDAQIKEGWVDFEKEISRIIQIIDTGRKTKKIHLINNTGKSNSKIEEYASRIIEPVINDGANEIGINTLSELKDKLLGDLNRTTRALELYFAYYVQEKQLEEADIRLLPLISKLSIDRVLSFNYTNTFERLYGVDKTNIRYDYIHGKAKKGIGDGFNVNTCNMVLGIDEYLNEQEKNSENEFIEFKKFFQRIYKKTGSQYKVWLGNLNQYNKATEKGNPYNINIYFYGHSLDITDRDIIAELIRQPHTLTTVYYHSRKALSDQIANLVKILGEDELISRTGDYNPTIVFEAIDQTDEFEIANK